MELPYDGMEDVLWRCIHIKSLKKSLELAKTGFRLLLGTGFSAWVRLELFQVEMLWD